jgi:HD-GYP domain-containing protein (c-di-GMP phosphodiesterase class II)
MSKPSEAFDFVAIRTNSLIGNSKIRFDVFIKVGARHILYCRSGDVFDKERLARLQEKSTDTLYIMRGDLLNYQMYLTKSVDAAHDEIGKLSMPARAEAIANFNTKLTKQMMNQLDNQNTYIECKSSAQHFALHMKEERDALRSILAMANENKDVSEHGVRVAALALALAEELNLLHGKPVPLFMLGCFLHDVEFHHSPFEYRRPLSEMSKEDIAIYKKHPNEGARRAQTIDFIEPLVKQIILQHEEHADGSGFPRGLTEKDMDPIILVVGIANRFDRLIYFEGKTPKDALKSLLIDSLGAYPLSLIQTFQAVLKKRGVVS